MASTPQEAETILLISHVVPCPPTAGNEIRILNMVSWLKSQGFAVVLLLNHGALSADRTALLESVFERVHFVDDDLPDDLRAVRRPLLETLREKLASALPDSALYRALFGMDKEKKTRSNGVKRQLASDRLIQATEHLCRLHGPSAVLAEYVFSAPCLDVVPEGTLKIIDTHDMFSRKREQVLAYGIDDPLPCSPREERAYLLKCDLIIAIQSDEARMLGELAGEREVVTTGIDFDVVDEVDDRAVVPGRILVVGSHNPQNVHGLREFLAQAWPAIREARPEATLRVVGKLADEVRTDDERVELSGWVEDLDEEYRAAALVLNPTRAGTGLKIKSVEALCRGKALVGTPNSVEGIEVDGEPPFRVGGDWRQFGDAVLALLASEDERRALQRRAWRFARENFTSEKVYAALGRKLSEHARARRQDRRPAGSPR